jgi:hypothetical protein
MRFHGALQSGRPADGAHFARFAAFFGMLGALITVSMVPLYMLLLA